MLADLRSSFVCHLLEVERAEGNSGTEHWPMSSDIEWRATGLTVSYISMAVAKQLVNSSLKEPLLTGRWIVMIPPRYRFGALLANFGERRKRGKDACHVALVRA